MSWLSNVGKLMLTVAGLVALLDLAGPNGVAGWAGRAEKRHKETDERWAGLKAARRDEARVRRTATWAACEPPETSTDRASRPDQEGLDGLMVEDFLAFRREAWAAIRADDRYDSASLRSPQYVFPFFEDRAYTFLISRLPEPRGAALALAYRAFEDRKRRWQGMRLTLLGAVPPGTAALGWWFHVGGLPWVASIFVAFLAVGVVSLGSVAALLTPRFVMALLRAAATVRLGLARAAVRAMGDGRDARPLRVIALGVFVVGSLLDLVGGW
ncbi:hypothetical protein E1258_10865 [Micromonospora sp. KC207]|uniref:hypothetical protein n=1 Tax=Micromonospora sp. KC207 TaxID=2530377 RepID=UPI00104DF65E|nr:hypothetical protein [Micromonospora sp. KC207]TDC61637.1 hypothetical protein E1258_10865 [Micromonospora sp. KC207]